MAQEEITLTLKPEEVNVILEGVGNLPFVKVYSLISKIQNQASAQLSAEHGQPEVRNNPISEG